MYRLEEIKAMNAEQTAASTLRVAKAEVVERAEMLIASLHDANDKIAAEAHLDQAVRRLERIEKGLGLGDSGCGNPFNT